MRQVPDQTHSISMYCIIGAGKMASHFAHYLSLLSIPYFTLTRTDINAQSIQCALKAAGKVCLLITDNEIADFIASFQLHNHPKIVHFSGCQVIEGCYSAHPLMTFGPALYTLAQYQSIPFIIENEGPEFEALLPGLANHTFRIPRVQKPYYHSLCVLGGNFTCILLQKCLQTMESKFHIEPNAVMPYINQVIQNVMLHPNHALTGPLARNDQKTITDNLTALEQNHDSFSEIYQAFVSTFSKLREQEHECID